MVNIQIKIWKRSDISSYFSKLWGLGEEWQKFWRQKNIRSFEDRERILEEINSLFLKILYLWAVAYVSPLTISYSDFLVLLLLVRWFILYTFYVLMGDLRFNDMRWLFKKKKKNWKRSLVTNWRVQLHSKVK